MMSKHSICTVCYGFRHVALAILLHAWGRPKLQLPAWRERERFITSFPAISGLIRCVEDPF